MNSFLKKHFSRRITLHFILVHGGDSPPPSSCSAICPWPNDFLRGWMVLRQMVLGFWQLVSVICLANWGRGVPPFFLTNTEWFSYPSGAGKGLRYYFFAPCHVCFMWPSRARPPLKNCLYLFLANWAVLEGGGGGWSTSPKQEEVFCLLYQDSTSVAPSQFSCGMDCA